LLLLAAIEDGEAQQDTVNAVHVPATEVEAAQGFTSAAEPRVGTPGHSAIGDASIHGSKKARDERPLARLRDGNRALLPEKRGRKMKTPGRFIRAHFSTEISIAEI
jgi:hypothetical protein